VELGEDGCGPAPRGEGVALADCGRGPKLLGLDANDLPTGCPTTPEAGVWEETICCWAVEIRNNGIPNIGLGWIGPRLRIRDSGSAKIERAAA